MVQSKMYKSINDMVLKAIMTRSKLRNRYPKFSTRDFFLNYKRAKNTCNNLTNSQKCYVDKVSSKGFVSTKAFWNTSQTIFDKQRIPYK